MNRFGPGLLSRLYQRIKIEIAFTAQRRSDMNGLIGGFDMQGATVCIRVDGDTANAHLLAGAQDAQSNFASVGDEYFTKHILGLVSIWVAIIQVLSIRFCFSALFSCSCSRTSTSRSTKCW